MTGSQEVIVIGGGLVGAALAFGLRRLGHATLMLDEGDTAFRAARGNFGLIWVQSKGVHFPPYARWTWTSAEAWRRLHEELLELTGTDTGYARPGGVEVCLDADELADKRAEMESLRGHASWFTYEMLDHKALADLLPGLGGEVTGGTYSPADGHVNPLYLLRGLHAGFRALGGQAALGARVTAIRRQGANYAVTTETGTHCAARLVIAAGLGSQVLAAMLGLDVPVRPQRGQLLVTERLEPFLGMPLSEIRQTVEGSVLLGSSNEEVGFDEATTCRVMNAIARRAVRVFPRLGQARVVRAWGALRVMTPDGYPVYQHSDAHPGAFAAVCHSGVTLAAAHVYELARAISAGSLPEGLAPMAAGRFHHAAN